MSERFSDVGAFLNGLLTVYAYDYIDEEQILEITRDNDISDKIVQDFMQYHLELEGAEEFIRLIKENKYD